MAATVRRFLDLSTLHLPEELGVFDDDWGEGAHVTALRRGWLLWVPDDPVSPQSTLRSIRRSWRSNATPGATAVTTSSSMRRAPASRIWQSTRGDGRTVHAMRCRSHSRAAGASVRCMCRVRSRPWRVRLLPPLCCGARRSHRRDPLLPTLHPVRGVVRTLR